MELAATTTDPSARARLTIDAGLVAEQGGSSKETRRLLDSAFSTTRVVGSPAALVAEAVQLQAWTETELEASPDASGSWDRVRAIAEAAGFGDKVSRASHFMIYEATDRATTASGAWLAARVTEGSDHRQLELAVASHQVRSLSSPSAEVPHSHGRILTAAVLLGRGLAGSSISTLDHLRDLHDADGSHYAFDQVAAWVANGNADYREAAYCALHAVTGYVAVRHPRGVAIAAGRFAFAQRATALTTEQFGFALDGFAIAIMTAPHGHPIVSVAADELAATLSALEPSEDARYRARLAERIARGHGLFALLMPWRDVAPLAEDDPVQRLSNPSSAANAVLSAWDLAPRGTRPGRPGRIGAQLSPRQWEILGAIEMGLPRTALIKRLSLGPNQIDQQIEAILRRTGTYGLGEALVKSWDQQPLTTPIGQGPRIRDEVLGTFARTGWSDARLAAALNRSVKSVDAAIAGGMSEYGIDDEGRIGLLLALQSSAQPTG
jgi:hypothetical protein